MLKPWTASRRLAAVLALLSMLAGGCRADLALDVDLAADGSGRFAVALTADEELRDRAAAAEGGDPLDLLAEAGDELEGWSTTEETGADGSRTVTLTAAFDDPDELTALTGAFADGLAGPELAPLSALRLTVEETTLRLDGEASLVPEGDLPDLGLDADAAIARALDDGSLGAAVTVRLPGPVIRSDADEVDEDARTAVWRLEPGVARPISVVAERPAASLWPLVAGGVLGGLVALAAVVLLQRRRGARRR